MQLLFDRRFCSFYILLFEMSYFATRMLILGISESVYTIFHHFYANEKQASILIGKNLIFQSIDI